MSRVGGPKPLHNPILGYRFQISAQSPRSKTNKTVHGDKEEEESQERRPGAEEGETRVWGRRQEAKAELPWITVNTA